MDGGVRGSSLFGSVAAVTSRMEIPSLCEMKVSPATVNEDIGEMEEDLEEWQRLFSGTWQWSKEFWIGERECYEVMRCIPDKEKIVA